MQSDIFSLMASHTTQEKVQIFFHPFFGKRAKFQQILLGKVIKYILFCFRTFSKKKSVGKIIWISFLLFSLAPSYHSDRVSTYRIQAGHAHLLQCKNSFNYTSIEVALSHKQARMAAGGEVKLSNEDFQRNLEDQNDEVGLTCPLW